MTQEDKAIIANMFFTLHNWICCIHEKVTPENMKKGLKMVNDYDKLVQWIDKWIKEG